MKINEAKELAEQLIDKTFVVGCKPICARNIGYRFEWMRGRKTLGQCFFGSKIIKLSSHYVKDNDEELVKDTILHELAHAFNYHIYEGRGHGLSWRFCCGQIGARPIRCKSESDGLIVGGHKYVLRHIQTKEVFSKFHKWPSSTVRNIKSVYIRNRKRETYGMLEVVPVGQE